MRPLALVLLWVSYISTQIIAMFNFGDTLMTHGLDVRRISLKICIDLMIDSTILELIDILVFSKIYRIPMILRWDLD